MGTLAVGTVVAKNYIPFARVLAESFRRHHPDIPFFVVLADEVEGYFDPAAEPFSMLTLRDLAIPHLERFCFHYSRQPVVVAAKAYLLSYLLEHGFSSAIFLDADILVLDNLDALFAVVEKNSILLTPHLLAPLAGEECAERELNILLSGTYNGGFLGVSDAPSTRAFLTWWQDRLYEHCCHAVELGMHYDQHWLDLVPVYFEGVHILRDPAYNIAYWALPERNAHVPENLRPVDTQPCRLFHFSGFDPEQPPAVTRYSPRLTMGNVGPAVSLFDHYATLLIAAGYQAAKSWPYFYNCFDNGVPIPNFARQLYRDLGNSAERFDDPRRAAGTGSYFHWLNEPIDSSGDPALRLTQLWRAIYERRRDLQIAIPDALGANRLKFVKWATTFGAKELSISESFIPPEWKADSPR
jgi:hypothetical protein